MADIFFIGDTHFFHANIMRFTDRNGDRIRREFTTLDECHEAMIERWNARVKPTDTVYHLGDVSFKYGSELCSVMSRLNGRKRLIVGNHDDVTQPSLVKWFERIYLWRKFKDDGFTCTHIPSRLDQLRGSLFNVHGHIHRGVMTDPRYINVSVEVIDYRPVHLDEIKTIIATRSGRKSMKEDAAKTTALHSI